MKKLFIAVLFFLLAINLYAVTGLEIMQTQDERQSTQTEYIHEQMLLISGNGDKEARQVIKNIKQMQEGQNRALVTFIEPASIKGTALLTWEQVDRDDDQWLYMTALGKMQRIAKGSKKNYFMGTDFTYEDMSSEDLDNFDYTIINEEQIEGHDCWVIEAKPVASYKKDSSYSKRVLWVDKEIYSTVKIDFYARNGDLIKTQQSKDFENIEGTVYRAKMTLMNNFKEDHKTLIKTVNTQINKPIKDEVFTERYILNGLHTQVQ